MIIVIDLMRNIFIIMFFVLMALEVIVLISLTTLYKIPLEENQSNVESASMNNLKDVLGSFNNILTRKIYNIETDLMIIAKHIYPMYLAQDSTVVETYPKLLKDSQFYKSYTGCLENGIGLDLNSLYGLSNYVPNIGVDNALYYLLYKYNYTIGWTEDKVIDTLLKDDVLNKIVYFPDFSTGVGFSNTDDMEHYVCYTVSIFKTLLIRNLIFEKNYLVSNKYLLFLNNQYIYQYPIDFLNKTSITYIDYYNAHNPNCASNSYTNSCFDNIKNFTTSNGYDLDKDIYFSVPTINNYDLSSRACIKIPFPTSSTLKDSNFACIDFNINSILKDIAIGTQLNIVDLFLVSEFGSDLQLHYTNVVDLNYLNKTVFSSSELGSYQLISISTSYSLFHGIYYSIFANVAGAASSASVYESEYSSLLANLTTVMDNFKAKSGQCDYSRSVIQNITAIQSFLQQDNNLNVNTTVYSVGKDKFQFVLYPIKLNYTAYNNTNYIFTNDCSPKILFYSLAMVRVGTETLPSEIYFVLILKCVRNWFFFVSLLLFANIVYFILCEIYVKYLVSPIKNIRHSLEKLIKERNLQEEDDTSPEREKEKEGHTKDHENRGTELTLYRNRETKKLEDLLNFLKKIVIMKQAHGNTDFKVQSKIYTKFLGFLGNLEEKEHYRQCLLIIAYSKYKDNSFSDAYEALEILKKSTELEEAELLGKNDSLEQKIINLPSQMMSNLIPYLNEFTDNEISSDNDLNKLIKLRVFNQKILYFYGLIKFLDFAKKKQDLKERNIPKKERYERMKEEFHLLEDAIVNLKKALQINYTMNFNQIKSIFILILIAKCNFYSEDYTEATNSLKEALIKFSDLNKYFFDKFLSEQIDPRVMFVTNGIIIEQILFYLGRICEKIGKKQLSGWIFNKLMEISYFRTNEIHRKAVNKLYKFLFEKESANFLEKKIHLEKKFLLEKVCRRVRKTPANKKLCIVVSENLLKNFNSTYELREVILKCLENYINQFDLISYFQFDSNIQSLIPEAAKAYNLKIFSDSSSFCKYTENLDDNRPDFYKAIDTAVSILTKDEGFYAERGQETHDTYIFNFIFSEDFRFSSANENRELAKKLIENNVSLYTFCLDENIPQKKLQNIKKYSKDLVEGYLILVKNFKVIKQAFQNISNKGTQKNILQSNFENHKYIL